MYIAQATSLVAGEKQDRRVSHYQVAPLVVLSDEINNRRLVGFRRKQGQSDRVRHGKNQKHKLSAKHADILSEIELHRLLDEARCKL